MDSYSDEWILKMRGRRALLAHYMVTGAHTQKPEKMFRRLIRKRIIWIERRRGKPPIVRWYADIRRPIWSRRYAR